MADEAPKKNGLKRPIMTVALITLVAILEAGVFIIVIRYMGAGAEAAYGQGEHAMAEIEAPEIATAEVSLLQGFRVPNTKSGKTIIYDFDITVVCPADDPARLEAIQQALAAREAAISDRAAQLVRSASPRVLEEDDFRTLREQLQMAIMDVLGDPDAVQQVLIPRCVPIGVH